MGLFRRHGENVRKKSTLFSPAICGRGTEADDKRRPRQGPSQVSPWSEVRVIAEPDLVVAAHQDFSHAPRLERVHQNRCRNLASSPLLDSKPDSPIRVSTNKLCWETPASGRGSQPIEARAPCEPSKSP